jgi:VWFA-related protein
VTVDVVVRDQRGTPVTDLRRADFKLLEEGVVQEIGDFTLVADLPRTGLKSADAELRRDKPAASGARPPAPTPAPTFLALVFDRLSPEGRALSHKGALAYLDTNREHDFAGVFLSDLSLVTVQTYTTDRVRLRKAIDEVATRVTSPFDRLRIGPRAFGDPDPGTPPTASAESEGSASPGDPNRVRTVDPAGTGAMDLAAMMSRMERSFEAMQRDQQGHATINSLLAVISALGELPGRKGVIFFAEALAIPPNVLAQFESVVTTANRLNVSVYSIDSAGLRVHSGQGETARRVNSIGAEALSRDPDKPGGKMTETLELNEDTLRRDPAVSLRLLAERTGGFLINNTNDLAGAFRRIDEDRRFHYLLTYTPANTNFRGEWRRITVTVPGRNVTVRARSGYLAVRTPGALPLLSHEGPALAALDRTPLPAEVPVRAGAFVFPQPRSMEARVAVLVATDGGVLAVDADKSKGTARTDFTILSRLKDASGEVVRKASQPYRLTAPAANLRGEVLFFRQPTLPLGTYTLEYVVHDGLGQRAGAGTMPVVVPDARTGQPQVSSLMIVRRTERVPTGERDATNPLYYGDLLLYPNLGEPISKRETPTISFAFTVVLGTNPVLASLALSQGERTLGETTLPTGTPDANGVIWHVSQLPLAGLPAGEYSLTVTVTGGGHTETRRATFRTTD